MPRYTLDLEGLESVLSAEQVVDLLKEHVDLSRLGVSEEFAQTLQAVYEEFGGQHVGQDLLDCIFDCSCCVMAWEMTCADTCSRAMAGSGGGDKKKKEKESLVQVPQQEMMPESWPTGSWLQQLRELSAEDLQMGMRSSKSFINMEKFAKFIFEKKFGKDQVKQFEMCAEQMKSEGPKIVEKDKLDIDDLLAKSKKADFKSFIKLIRVVTAAAMAKHGAAIQEKGLDAIGLGKCAEVLCAGDMKYELDQSGLHKCVWTCPKDHLPDQFQAVSFDIPKESEKVFGSMSEADSAGEAALKDAETDPKKYEKTSTYAKLKKLVFHFHPAYTEAPMKLLQMNSTTVLGNDLPHAFRYHGKCRTTVFEAEERVVFAGTHDHIPTGELVKIERLPSGSTWLGMKKKLDKDQIQVKYLGKAYVVAQRDLHREPLAKIKVDEAVQQWMRSTGDTIEISSETALHDPSHKQHKDTLWFPVSSAEKEKNKTE